MEVLKKSRRGREQRVAILGPTDSFGEMSILDMQTPLGHRARARAPRASSASRPRTWTRSTGTTSSRTRSSSSTSPARCRAVCGSPTRSWRLHGERARRVPPWGSAPLIALSAADDDRTRSAGVAGVARLAAVFGGTRRRRQRLRRCQRRCPPSPPSSAASPASPPSPLGLPTRPPSAVLASPERRTLPASEAHARVFRAGWSPVSPLPTFANPASPPG